MESRKIKLRTKLIVAFVFTALFAVVIISIASNILLEGSFKDYVHSKHVSFGSSLTENLSQYYEDGEWNYNGVTAVCNMAMQQGIQMEIIDINGDPVLSNSNHHGNGAGHTNDMLANPENTSEEFFDIIKDGERVGEISLLYYYPNFYNEQDANFIETLNVINISTGAIVSIAAVILGSVLAIQISKPVSAVTATASKISEGNYKNKINLETNTAEISELISSFNNLADNLENQHVLRKRLTSDLSHELRTPLALLQSHIEAMIDGIWEPTPERLLSLKTEIGRLNIMVGDLERLNQIDAESFDIHFSDFNLKDLIDNIFTHFEKDFDDKKINFTITGESFSVHADKDKFSQVLINLLSNSLKYSNENSNVGIAISKNESQFSLTIKDTGIGIPEEDLPYVFTRFYRSDKSRSRTTGGNGIGLAIVKSIVDAHGGSIKIESEINKGTGIEINIPQ